MQEMKYTGIDYVSCVHVFALWKYVWYVDPRAQKLIQSLTLQTRFDLLLINKGIEESCSLIG